jgi:hypothetical protein
LSRFGGLSQLQDHWYWRSRGELDGADSP